MKKYISIILIFVFLFISTFDVVAQYNNNPLDIDEKLMEDFINGDIEASISNLCRLDIIRDPFSKWKKGDTISRRNAFEMAYIVYFLGFRVIYGKGTVPIIETDDFSFHFEDIEKDTYDYYLVATIILNCGLMSGKMDNDGKKYADLDSDLTYGEALAIISRLFNRNFRIREKLMDLWNKDKEGSNSVTYMEFCENLGLINSNTYVNYSTLSITEDMLANPISAYEFMHLLNYVLYVPTVFALNYPNIYGTRYIDFFVALSDEMKSKNNDEKPGWNIIP